MKRLAILPLALLGIVGCGGGNPLHETALAISSAAALGRIAQLTLGPVGGGTASACVQVGTACTSYPCQGAATVRLGSACPLPLGGEATGTVSVSGSWSSADHVTMVAELANVEVGKQAVALARASSLNVTRSGNQITVQYAGSDAEARSGVDNAAIGAASSWTVVVNDQGTADLGDDSLSIDAASASGGAGLGTSAKATSLSGVTIDASCARNPTAGTGSVVEVSGLIPKIQQISFHAACDGKGMVNGDAHDFDVTP